MSSPQASDQSPCQDAMVTVQICDRRKCNGIFIAPIPLSVLQDYAPAVCHLIELDGPDYPYHLPIRLPLHAHVEDVELAGLTRLLSHWTDAAANPTGSLLPHPASLGEGIILYRALQLMLDPEAETLRAHLLQSLHSRPAAECDVQAIWWAFQGKPEWPSWLDALMCNLARFHVLTRAPQGTSILLFIEAELLQLDDVQASEVLLAFRKHAKGTNRCLRTALERGAERVIRLVVSFGS